MPSQTRSRTEGLSYVFHENGLELPVLDLAHPAFSMDADPAKLEALARKAAQDQANMERLPPFFRRLVMRLFLSRSVIGRGLLSARAGHRDGLSPYLLRLGADNLGPWAGRMDKRLAASHAGLSLRLRSRGMVALLPQRPV